ncbi:hypothetical protein VPH35_063844 [Triticum aestivum]|uniref:DUF7597 domain-containing protein n=1 Tax=Aegilops tauschii TaxID=37682 RepID=M8BCI7_AEGTA
MATYPCDPLPLLPPGTAILEADGNRRRRSYHYLGGEPLVQSRDWAVISLAPPPDPNQFDTDAMLIRHYLDHERGFRIAEISRCGMGAALVRFQHACDIDTAIANSPYFIGDLVLRVIRHDRGSSSITQRWSTTEGGGSGSVNRRQQQTSHRDGRVRRDTHAGCEQARCEHAARGGGGRPGGGRAREESYSHRE